MALSARRKRFQIVAGLLILAAFAAVPLYMLGAGSGMDRFCGSLAVGSSLEQVRAGALEHGYGFSQRGDEAFAHAGAFGRRGCDLRFGAEGLESAVYSVRD